MKISAKIIVAALFFMSGVSGLIYEVTWIRMFGHVFGITTYAVSAVIGAFFAGLALGGFLAGKRADIAGAGPVDEAGAIANPHIKSRLILIYAYLELGIAASAVMVYAAMPGLKSLFVWFNHSAGGSPVTLNIARFVLSFAILLIPSTLMGATLPILSKFFISRYQKVKQGLGLLYGINTSGAAIGCLAAGFYLVGTLGVFETICVGAAINLAIGVAALILNKTSVFNIADEKEPQTATEHELEDKNCKQKSSRAKSAVKERTLKARSTLKPGNATRKNNDLPKPIINALMIAFGVSGFTSIAYEIIWTRMLSLVFLNSIYSFTTMLVTFLTGIAVGALIAARFFRKGVKPIALFGIVEFGIGVSTILLILLFHKIPDISAWLGSSNAFNGGAMTWGGNVKIEFALSFMIMIAPSVLIGMTLPIVGQIITNDVKILGRKIGSIYSINTVGGIIGALVAGVLLIPALGFKNSELLLGGINICIGLIFLCIADKRNKVWGGNAHPARKVLAPVLCVSAIGIGCYCSFKDIRVWDKNNELLYYKEAAAATVSVTREKDGNRKLVVNNRYTLGTSVAEPLQLRMGYIPLLLHGEPKETLIIGMGTGITAAAAVMHEQTETVNCVEVISDVAKAAQKYFANENGALWQSEKLNIIIGDGRNHLLLNKKQYDVIISDLFVPYHAGAGSLYTKEHFNVCRERLLEDGLFCQWLPLYQMSEKEFKAICKTFTQAFPHATLWFCNFERGLICGLIGSNHKQMIDPFYLAGNMRAGNMRNKLKTAAIGGPKELLSLYITDKGGIEAFAEEGAINTDNLPVIEFFSPKNIFAGQDRDLKSAKKGFTHPGLKNLSIAANLKGDVANVVSFNGRKYARPSTLESKEAENAELKDAGYYSDAARHIIAGMIYFYRDMLAEAEEEYLTAWELASDHLYLRKVFQDLSVKFYRMGNYKETIFINEKLADAEADIIDPYLHFYLGLAYQAVGEDVNAISAYRNAIALKPKNIAAIHYNMGIIYQNQGFHEKASVKFDEAKKAAQ